MYENESNVVQLDVSQLYEFGLGVAIKVQCSKLGKFTVFLLGLVLTWLCLFTDIGLPCNYECRL